MPEAYPRFPTPKKRHDTKVQVCLLLKDTSMGHDHEPPYKVPHYSTFKVDGIKQLEDLRAALEKHGLCDPWIRNEAWRYHPGFGNRRSRAIALFTRGMPIGIAAAFVVSVISYVISEHDDHGHGGGH
ncbi:NADH-ubiquinone oxidoreductase b12 subunit family domain-containing protein [Phthorimaea operculella]|nr:NADH-ubiquinone oxidoreductase b12 subunit family domain-containing protein [Phthorimaea operculella]